VFLLGFGVLDINPREHDCIIFLDKTNQNGKYIPKKQQNVPNFHEIHMYVYIGMYLIAIMNVKLP
jgi:hypothetical protein